MENLKFNESHNAVDVRKYTEQHSKAASEKMIERENQTRKATTLKIGDRVWLRLFKTTGFKHLSDKCDGPYTIVGQMKDKPNTFELDLPEGDRRHRWVSGEHLMRADERPAHLKDASETAKTADTSPTPQPPLLREPRIEEQASTEKDERPRSTRVRRPPTRLNLFAGSNRQVSPTSATTSRSRSFLNLFKFK